MMAVVACVEFVASAIGGAFMGAGVALIAWGAVLRWKP